MRLNFEGTKRSRVSRFACTAHGNLLKPAQMLQGIGLAEFLHVGLLDQDTARHVRHVVCVEELLLLPVSAIYTPSDISLRTSVVLLAWVAPRWPWLSICDGLL